MWHQLLVETIPYLPKLVNSGMEDPLDFSREPWDKEAGQPTADPGMIMDSVEAGGDMTPPTKRKSKFSGFGKIFKPWKWRKKKSSDKFKETSEVLERKISMRKPREELVKRGVLLEDSEQDGEEPGKLNHAMLKNGHTTPIGDARSSNPVPVEEEPERIASLGKPVPEEDPKKQLGSTGSRPNSEAEFVPENALGSALILCPGLALQSIVKPSYSEMLLSLFPAVNSGTLLSKPSPPLPPKRGIPSTLVPTSESAAATTKAPSDQREKSTCSVGSEQLLLIPPPSPSPPLPTHIPPEPPRSPPLPAKTFQVVPETEFAPSSDLPQEVSPQEDQKKEAPKRMLDHSFGEPHVPSRLPPLPLHIRIQQALTSPLPISSSLEGSHRAHSLLFENSDNFSEDSNTLGRTRSLPITIEMLKVPDDEEEEQTHPSAFSEDMPPTSVTPKLPQCLQEEEEEKESDSDSEGPIQYRDDEDEDESQNSALANKVKRKDTLAMKLNHRPSEPELNLNSWPRKSKEEWNEIRHQIGNTLIRRLSQRPTPEELEQRNILQPKNEADRQAEKREIKRRLTRKLSQRPTVAELLARKILRFNEYVEVTDAQDYDRRADKPWTKLTPADKAAIRKELNEFKSSEMEVHEESKHFTRYHRP
ncbi:PREDICTED: phosphatase and actin regulator 4 [Myotis davidii]|uniref:phosphatase and actin regulator 4 n=1 Tax=Myotis davidii TaxID=225400 RepID=UPI0003EBEA54|nr:PREDICTED: phosphatase and actin regulator 4 [Myotis davidii]